ncbi:MAG: hypothetical protein HY043_14445 [Verrucomicrobia bacterium]|nr:hypothetical protein [Verrucomicrobiota bacterium]
MFRPVDTRDRHAVENEIQSIYRTHFPQGKSAFVAMAFGWVADCFAGKFRDYQAIDARYHDLEHTMQGTLCMARLMAGYAAAAAEPVLDARRFELGLLAILLHDTGYLKLRGDDEGTGAKYTLIHVGRSADFAEMLLGEKGYSPTDIATVRQMIRCTGVNTDVTALNFAGTLERKLGFALGTADLLGQMAAPDYIEKLPVLYLEFAESARSPYGRMSPPPFASQEDLTRRTPAFWEKFVLPKINVQFEGLYQFLNSPYPDGPNEYLDRVEVNIARLRERLKEQPAC